MLAALLALLPVIAPIVTESGQIINGIIAIIMAIKNAANSGLTNAEHQQIEATLASMGVSHDALVVSDANYNLIYQTALAKLGGSSGSSSS
jgi:hypothetical protein